jgi:uncharacterized protein YqgC (DUF456 family)
MLLLALAVVLLVCIALIPLGLPGTWLMVAAAFGFNALGGARIGTTTLIIIAVLTIVAEVLEFTVAARYTRQYGGSRRAGWGAIFGGLIGAFVGIPIPIIGSVIGGFIGAFAGAFVAEWSRRADASSPTRVATGALLGRAAGAAIKTAFGLAIAVWVLFAAWS